MSSFVTCPRNATKFRELDSRNDSRCGSRSGSSESGVRTSPHPGEPNAGAPKAQIPKIRGGDGGPRLG